jgi:2-dehydro-3-deoxygluconokinase
VSFTDGAELVTMGETMALLSAPRVGPLRHMPHLNLTAAGAESNVAIGIRRLGGTAALISRVGDDEFGRLVTSTVAAEGVDVTHIVVDDTAPTGLMIKERRSDAVTRVTYYRSGSAASKLSPADVDEALIRSARVLHLTGTMPALSPSAAAAVDAAVETARSAGVPVSLDLNYRSALWDAETAGTVLRELAARADLLFATVPEARLLVAGDSDPDLAAQLAKLGPRQVFVKRGARGVLGRVDDIMYDLPARRVTAVDQVGAGDAFAAGYLAELIAGRPVEDRFATALAAGAFAVASSGDWEGLPLRSELGLLDADPDDGVLR